MAGVPPVICSAQGKAPLATKPENMPWPLVLKGLVKPEPSAHFALTAPPIIGAPTAAVPVNCKVATLFAELEDELLSSELDVTLLCSLLELLCSLLDVLTTTLLCALLLIELLLLFLSLSLPQPVRAMKLNVLTTRKRLIGIYAIP